MRMNNIKFITAGLMATAYTIPASAQVPPPFNPPSIYYALQGGVASIPTLSEFGLIALGMALLGGALYFLKAHQGKGHRLMSLLVALLGVTLLMSKQDVIQNAWAVIEPFSVVATGADQGVVSLNQGDGIYEITNGNASTIKITDITNETSCNQFNPNYLWIVTPYSNAPQTPGCDINSQVAPNAKCYVSVYCTPPPS
jgi:hypothetical protein